MLIFSVVLLSAQNVDKAKKERRIYLWDVTMSMQGYGRCNNIWNDVKTKLIKDIDGIMDPETEIILLPFQHKIIDSITVTATAAGKNAIKCECVKCFKQSSEMVVADYTGVC